MCLIITQPAGHTLSRSHLLDIHARNGDGFGIMRAIDGTLHTWRTVGDVDDVLELYHAHAAGHACVLHWRMATHGAVNLENAHPFRLTRDIAVVHNGVLTIGTPTKGKSDTWHFAKHVLAPMARDNGEALFSPDTLELLGGMIGSSNKLVFQHADGRVAIVNKHVGIEHKGRWYSNTYAWDAPSSTRTTYRTRSVWDSDDDWRVTPRGAAVVATHGTQACTPCTPDAPDADLEDGDLEDAEFTRVAIRAELLVQYDDRGDMGVLEWIRDYPSHAADVLCEGYRVEYDDALQYIADEPASVAGWIADLLHADAV